jgi:hypothetical protein
MKDKKYQVIIFNDKKSIMGRLDLYENEHSLEFNPLTILSDLTFKSNSNQNNNYLNVEEDICDIDGFSYEFEYGFGHKIAVDGRDQYARLIRDLKRIIIYDKILLPTDIEYLKPFYDITFEMTLAFKETHPMQKFIKNQLSDEKFFHYSNLSVLKAIDKIHTHKLVDSHAYFFDCFSLADVVFSIFYFLILNGFKFSKCLHCENYFATTTYKNKFCNRKSSYKKLESLDCEDAVRYLRQKLRLQQKRITSNISSNHPERLTDFYLARDNYKDFKKLYSIIDFKKCENFLYDTNKWYK